VKSRDDAAKDVRVAILEDQRVMRETLAEVLEDAGAKVMISSGDPQAFLERLGAEEVAVAIVDLTLEQEDGVHGDGLMVLSEIQRWHPEVRTLVLSGSRAAAVVEQCYAAGAAGYLYKLTTDVDSIVQAVQAVSRGERMIPFDFLQKPRSSDESAKSDSASAARNLLAAVTSREREVLAYVASGADNLKIATHLQITERTVKAHVSSLYRKLGPENRAQLALLARQLGVRPPSNV
jgi:DNA-binding NarL/FixJ family response regulator